MAIFMPWLEMLAALALVATPRWREAGSVVLGGLLLLFSVAAGSALWRGLNISCGCFTASADADPIGGWLFVRNGLLLGALALAVAVDRGWLQAFCDRWPARVPAKAMSLLLPGCIAIWLLLAGGATPASVSPHNPFLRRKSRDVNWSADRNADLPIGIAFPPIRRLAFRLAWPVH